MQMGTHYRKHPCALAGPRPTKNPLPPSQWLHTTHTTYEKASKMLVVRHSGEATVASSGSGEAAAVTRRSGSSDEDNSGETVLVRQQW